MALHRLDGGLTVRTHFEYPPIPFRKFDWCAVDDGAYEPGYAIGWGATEAEAIEDLLRLLEEEAA